MNTNKDVKTDTDWEFRDFLNNVIAIYVPYDRREELANRLWVGIQQFTQRTEQNYSMDKGGENELLRRYVYLSLLGVKTEDGSTLSQYIRQQIEDKIIGYVVKIEPEFEDLEYSLRFSLHDVNKAYNQGVSDALLNLDTDTGATFDIINNGKNYWQITAESRGRVIKKLMKEIDELKSPKP